MPADEFAALEQFECLASDDSVKRELELTCSNCNSVLCDVEHGDTLATLAGVAADHICPISTYSPKGSS